MAFNILNCIDNDAEYICDKLVEYNLSQVPKKQEIEFKNINKKVVDENDNIIAGCLAKMYCWNVIYIDSLWVDEKYRKCGLGTRLLNEIEKVALEENCSLIYLDTFDFQAKDFYTKQGYEVFGVLEDCPVNHCRYYLKKKLK
ncbi:MAG: GNAT family N-acetyltransferase [Lachnospiraceae bacterium]|nr:GNAT family N-acetyltransferase [Lachnospiraceae bacterium]